MATSKLARDLAPIDIARVAFGLRSRPSWKVGDRIGEILDRVLDSERFSREIFPITRIEGTARTLHNAPAGVPPEAADFLSLSESDCILSMEIKSRDLSKIRNLAGNFDRVVIQAMLDAGLTKVHRYGFLIDLEIVRDKLAVSPIEKYLGSQESGVRSMDLRFTSRLATEEGISKQRVSDYRNLIYLISQSEAGVAFSVDYQEYFDPMLDKGEVERKSFARFVDSGLNYFNTRFADWLKDFRGTQAA